MSRYILERVVHAVIVLVIISIVIFTLIHLAPGGPAALTDPNLTPEDTARIRHNLGLDQPIPIQYLRWMTRTIQGDLGRSFLDGQPVIQLILSRLPATLLLSLTALLLALIGGIPSGIISALKPYSIIDNLISVVAFTSVSIPSFWFGIVLILIFSVKLRLLPSAGMYTVGHDFSLLDRLAHLAMPALVLALFLMAMLIRYTRTSMREVLSEPYITTARAKGLPERIVIYRHAFRTALLPVVTLVGLLVPSLIGGSAIVETIFAWPGMGRLAVDAALSRNYPVVMGITVLVSVVVVLTNLIVDLLYSYLDPRVKLS
ncbi:MAG: ABC transporter permease [Ardenticatenaceae bacterium]|nr:ABC transporter permease [Ardenticatenaceae bacterium]